MVAEADVVMAYRLLMGREPESDEVVRGQAKAHKTLQDLRNEFLASAEFKERIGPAVAAAGMSGHKPLNWPATSVDVEVPSAIVDWMLARIESEFVDLGTTEPHWSVLTEDRFRSDRIADAEDDFFETGKYVVGDLRIAAERNGIDLSTYRTCLELGCGMGRSTIWLAEQFAEIFAADISPLHLRHAEQTARRFGRANIRFFHVNALGAYDRVPAFDVFFSIIVLQHNPPPVIRVLLRTILAKLNPGGIAYFQVPTYSLKYRFSAANYLDLQQPSKEVEVHFLPQRALFDILAEANCRLLEIREDGAVGAHAISNRLLVQKAA